MVNMILMRRIYLTLSENRIQYDWRNPDSELIALLVNHFPTYLRYAYHFINLPDSTPLQNRIAELLDDAPDRLILQAARGTGKSFISAIYTTWRLLRNVDEKVLVVSASGPKAIEIATFIRRLFDEVPLLHHLKPGKESRDSVLSFDVSGAKVSIAPSVAAVGITSQITGRRATLVLGDDVEVPNNSMTEEMREKLIQGVSEFESLLIPDVPSSVLMLGTPQSQESVYRKLPYYTVILPAQVPEDESVYEGKLDPWIMLQGAPNDATDKVRFPADTLQQREFNMGKANYKLQFMLDTTLSDAERFPLKCKDMIVYSINSEVAPNKISYGGSKDLMIKELVPLGFTGDRYYKPVYVDSTNTEYDVKIMSIDPSGSGTDETTYSILGVKNGIVYLIDNDGHRGGYSDEVLVWLSKAALKHKVQEIVPEKNFGSGMFTELFKKVLVKIYPCTVVDDFSVRGQKEVRIIDNLEPLLTNHQLVVNEELIKKDYSFAKDSPENVAYSLIYQLTHLTRDKGSLVHDDRLDSLAIGVQYLSNLVSVDVDKLLKEAEEKEMRDFLYSKIYKKGIGTANTNLLKGLVG